MRTAILASLVGLAACTSPGGSTTSGTPVAAQGASTIGGSQGTAQAQETGSATNAINPTFINLYGVTRAVVNVDENGAVSAEVEGDGNGTATFEGANLGVQIGDRSGNPSVSSGGGAAGGTGGAERGPTTTSTGATEEDGG